MLRTRLWMGAVLIALTVGALVLDERFAPFYPFLFAVVAGLSVLACVELRNLLPPARRPAGWLCYGSVAAVVAANWVSHFTEHGSSPWAFVLGVFTAVVLMAFLAEMAVFQ